VPQNEDAELIKSEKKRGGKSIFVSGDRGNNAITKKRDTFRIS
jgi:hypothetical protein